MELIEKQVIDKGHEEGCCPHCGETGEYADVETYDLYIGKEYWCEECKIEWVEYYSLTWTGTYVPKQSYGEGEVVVPIDINIESKEVEPIPNKERVSSTSERSEGV